MNQTGVRSTGWALQALCCPKVGAGAEARDWHSDPLSHARFRRRTDRVAIDGGSRRRRYRRCRDGTAFRDDEPGQPQHRHHYPHTCTNPLEPRFTARITCLISLRFVRHVGRFLRRKMPRSSQSPDGSLAARTGWVGSLARFWQVISHFCSP